MAKIKGHSWCAMCGQYHVIGEACITNVPRQPEPEREPLLVEREKTYGSFAKQGAFATCLKRTFKERPGYERLSDDQREALDMISTKISRLLHGDPMNKDTWDDIAGYAKLGAEACQK